MQNLDDFEIWNEHGKIKYIKQVDLTGVNLAVDVSICKGYIDVYSDENEKPALGQKLNHPALITLFNVQPKAKESVEDCRDRLRRLN